MRRQVLRALKVAQDFLRGAADFLEVAGLVIEDSNPGEQLADAPYEDVPGAEDLTGEVRLSDEAREMMATPAAPPEPEPEEPPLRGSVEARTRGRRAR